MILVTITVYHVYQWLYQQAKTATFEDIKIFIPFTLNKCIKKFVWFWVGGVISPYFSENNRGDAAGGNNDLNDLWLPQDRELVRQLQIPYTTLLYTKFKSHSLDLMFLRSQLASKIMRSHTIGLFLLGILESEGLRKQAQLDSGAEGWDSQSNSSNFTTIARERNTLINPLE